MPDSPSFSWDADALRYRSANGRFVADSSVREAVASYADSIGARMRETAGRLTAGTIDADRFHRQMRGLVKESTLAGTMIGVGGKGQLTDDQRAVASARTRFEFGYLRDLVSEVKSGAQPLDGSLLARAEMYAGAARKAHAAIQREERAEAGYREERRQVRGNASCGDCLAYAAQGWVPTGTLPGIGESCSCRSRCHCSFSFRLRDRNLVLSAPATPAEPDTRDVPTPAPTPRPDAAPGQPGVPILPGRPIAERLAAYTDGDRKVDEIAALGASTRAARRDYREAQFRIENLPKRIEQTADPAEKARLRGVYQESIRKRDAAKAEIDGVTVEARARLREIAGAATPQQWKHVGTGVAHPEVGRLIRESDDFLGPLVQTSATYPVQEAKWTVRKKAGYRANYETDKRTLNISPENDVAVVIHERGHHIEDMFPEVGDEARRFLKHRVGDEPLKPMGETGSGYDDDEFGRDDEFARYFGAKAGRYVGKDYDVGTEILSMGLQAMHEDPIAFAQKDPEYMKWVLGVLDGSLR